MRQAQLAEWLEFAEADLKVAKELVQKAEEFSNSICFHAQQCVEKSLKAILLSLGKGATKTHNLKELLKRIIQENQEFSQFKKQCARLDELYKPTRYPDALPGSLSEGLPTKEDAQEALKFAKEIFKFVKSRLEDKI